MACKIEIKKDIHGIDKYYRDGIELVKGAPMTMARILENEKLYEDYCSFFTAYPDLFEKKQPTGKRQENFLNCWDTLKRFIPNGDESRNK